MPLQAIFVIRSGTLWSIGITILSMVRMTATAYGQERRFLLKEGTDPRTGIAAVSHKIDLTEYGLGRDFLQEMEENNCRADASWEEFDGPGHHLVLRFSRPCPLGGRENFNCEWLGWYAKDGQLIRDTRTPVSEELLRNILIHNTVERAHLLQVLPDLYEAYKDQPLDAD